MYAFECGTVSGPPAAEGQGHRLGSRGWAWTHPGCGARRTPCPSVSSSVKWRTPRAVRRVTQGACLWSEAGSLEQRGSAGIPGRPCRAGLPLGSGTTSSVVRARWLPGETLAVHTANSIRLASDIRARSAVTVNVAGEWVTGRAATSRGTIGAGGPLIQAALGPRRQCPLWVQQPPPPPAQAGRDSEATPAFLLRSSKAPPRASSSRTRRPAWKNGLPTAAPKE